MRDRWISIPCRVRLDIYLVVMEGKGEGEKSGGEREGREGRDGSCLSEMELEKRENSGWKLKITLPQPMGEGVGMACLLKRQNNHYTFTCKIMTTA